MIRLMLVAGATGVIVLWSWPAEAERRSENTRAFPACPRGAGHGARTAGRPAIARPAPAEEPPALTGAGAKVVLDTSPRRPDEAPQDYRTRMRFVTAFEATRERAELSIDQVDAILLAIYDYRTNMEALWRDREQSRKQGREISQDDWVPLLRENLELLSRRIYGLMEPWQQDVWSLETCRYCFMDATSRAWVVRRADAAAMPRR